MADDVDYTTDQIERGNRYLLDQARRRAAEIPAGEPGECERCGEDSPRLVGGRCAPCRDGRNRTPAFPPAGEAEPPWH